MASPPGNTTSYGKQEQTLEQRMDPKLYALLFGNKNAVGSLALKDASRRGQIMRGVNAGDPQALQAYFGGVAPTPEMWAEYRGGAPKTESSETKAASGGLMSLRGYAPGKTVKPKIAKPAKGETPEQKAQRMNSFIQAGGTLNSAQNKWLSNYNTYAPSIKDGNFGIDYKTGMPAPPKVPQGATKAQRDQIYADYKKATGLELNAKGKWTTPAPPPEALQTTPGGQYSLAEAAMQKPVFWNPDETSGKYGGTTNPFFQKAIDQLYGMQEPGEYTRASDLYNQSAAGFTDALKYSPEQVAAQQAQAAQMQGPKDVSAERVDSSQYNVTAPEMQQYQMEGPGTWTEKGTQEKYMSPYMQGVIDISKREAARDFQKQGIQRAAQARAAGAFGGARQAIENAEAERNYGQRLSDMQVQGLQQAYESGRSQFGTEQSMSQQAAIQNLAAKLGVQQQEAAQILQAALANQSTGMQGSLANQQVALQAALANQQTGYNVGAFNAGNQQQVNLANQQAMLNAALANQQAGLTNQGMRLQGLGALGNLGTGMAGIGQMRNAYQQGLYTNWGQAGQTLQGLGEAEMLRQQQNAINQQTGVYGAVSPVIGQFPGMGQWGGSSTAAQQQRPANPFG